jgi:hypothetical protein
MSVMRHEHCRGGIDQSARSRSLSSHGATRSASIEGDGRAHARTTARGLWSAGSGVRELRTGPVAARGAMAISLRRSRAGAVRGVGRTSTPPALPRIGDAPPGAAGILTRRLQPAHRLLRRKTGACCHGRSPRGPSSSSCTWAAWPASISRAYPAQGKTKSTGSARSSSSSLPS